MWITQQIAGGLSGTSLKVIQLKCLTVLLYLTLCGFCVIHSFLSIVTCILNFCKGWTWF